MHKHIGLSMLHFTSLIIHLSKVPPLLRLRLNSRLEEWSEFTLHSQSLAIEPERHGYRNQTSGNASQER